MLNMLFALLQAVTTPNGEPQFTLGNVITIVVVIASAAGAVMRAEVKSRATERAVKEVTELMRAHTEQDRQDMREIRELIRKHTDDADEHIGRRLFDEIMRRLNAQDMARDRIETKLDAVIKQTK